ncbi:MAG: homocysteine S-methyltransferase family protein [Gemmataceae bacterium]
MVLLSNTFQAFPARLAKFGLREKTRAIIHAGVALARRAAGAAVLVLGSLGPLTASDEELDDVLDAFQASTGPDDSRGVDGLLLETLSDTSLLERVRPRLSRDVPLLFAATYRVGAAGPVTFEGLTPREVARRAAEAGADAVGFNCGKDIDARALGRIFEQYRAATALPLFARPNAGTPREESGRLVFPVDAETFARNLAPLRGKLAMVGGCCGTTPEYIRSLAACLRA